MSCVYLGSIVSRNTSLSEEFYHLKSGPIVSCLCLGPDTDDLRSAPRRTGRFRVLYMSWQCRISEYEIRAQDPSILDEGGLSRSTVWDIVVRESNRVD